MLGPRGSPIYPAGCGDYLLVADETGLPALERFLEELPGPAAVRAVVLGAAQRKLGGERDAEITWLPDAARLLDAVRGPARAVELRVERG